MKKLFIAIAVLFTLPAAAQDKEKTTDSTGKTYTVVFNEQELVLVSEFIRNTLNIAEQSNLGYQQVKYILSAGEKVAHIIGGQVDAQLKEEKEKGEKKKK